MRTHYTYWFEQGHIWRASMGGVFRAKMEILSVDRLLAGRLLSQHTESAKSTDYFAKRATELRDEMAEAIRQYDDFHDTHQPSQNPTSYGMGMENNHGRNLQESRA